MWAREVLVRIQNLSVGLKLDDFGTGYSSLATLQTPHFNSLKIDRSFVGRLTLDPQSHEIVQTIINLARTLDMTVVAEGIENEQQLAELISMGCEVGQGFYFCKPVGAETAQEMLTHGLQTDDPKTK